MRIINSLYPYPVISEDNDDYIELSKFNVSYSIVEATPFKKGKIRVKFLLNDPSMKMLITSGQANYYLHIECPRSAYRVLIEAFDTEQEIEINTEYMRTQLELTGFILTKKSIVDYKSDSINQEIYGPDYVFPKLEIGDPLAVSYTQLIDLPEKDNLKNVSSIMKVTQTNDKYMVVDYDSEIIFIKLPEPQYKNYLKYPQIFGEVTITSIIMPALIYILGIMANNEDSLSDRMWFKVIEEKLKSLNLDIQQLISGELNSVSLAQQILANPLDRMFAELEGSVKDE